MQIIQPTWAAPANIRAFTTQRAGGVSQPPFESLNLGDHVGDDPLKVQQNRQRLTEQGGLPHFPVFLTQTHSTKVLRLPLESGADLNADAVYSQQANQVCLVMTADCLPVLFCSRNGQEIAAAHAGWRGLCDGMLEATVAEFACDPSEIMAWLGPAIGPQAFQVGQEVIDQFCAVDPNAHLAFVPDPQASGKFFGNLYQIARQRLNKLGIFEISGGDYCTYTEAEKFFSYRRDAQTGRMATLIWRTA